MRGSVSLSEAYELSPEDQEMIANLIKENHEVAKKTNLPYF